MLTNTERTYFKIEVIVKKVNDKFCWRLDQDLQLATHKKLIHKAQLQVLSLHVFMVSFDYFKNHKKSSWWRPNHLLSLEDEEVSREAFQAE